MYHPGSDPQLPSLPKILLLDAAFKARCLTGFRRGHRSCSHIVIDPRDCIGRPTAVGLGGLELRVVNMRYLENG